MDGTRERTSLRLAASSSPGARERVTGMLDEEHRTLRIVVDILQRLLHEIAHYGIAPDFALLAAIVYYIDDFPERVHHPKEDRSLFPMLRRRTARFDSTIVQLRSDHGRSARMLARIERELVHFQAAAPRALERLATSVAAYAALLDEHIKTEEQLLVDAAAELTEDDWEHLARSLGADRDPLTADPARHEFRLLRARILNALPSKMRLDHDTADAMRRPPRV